MGIIKVNLNDVQEPTVIEADSEVTVRITSVKEGTDKNGYNYIMPNFEVPAVANAKPFNKYLALPHPDMDAKKKNSTGWALLQFFKAFQIDPDAEIDVEDMIGLEADAILGVENDPQYGDKNYVKRFVTGA